MKTQNKKGFTIVELVIVIAVIAILAAVLIPTFINLTKKANESNLTVMVTNLNKSLRTYEALNGEQKTMHGAVLAAQDAGYDLIKLASEQSEPWIVYDPEKREFVKEADVAENKKAGYFKIVDVANNAAGFSIYLSGEGKLGAIETNVGFDAGKNVTSVVNYTDEKEANVTIRMNGGELTVNNSQATVNYYGECLNANIQAVDTDCFNVYGKILGNLTLTKGKISFEATADVRTFIAAGGDITINYVSGAQIGTATADDDRYMNIIRNSQLPAECKSTDALTAEQKAQNALFAGGLGTEKSPYLIATAEQFVEIASFKDKMATSGFHFKLTSNIDLSSVSINDTYVSELFQGSIDGCNHVIKTGDSLTVLFKYITGTVLFKDFTIELNHSLTRVTLSAATQAANDPINLTYDNIDVKGLEGFSYDMGGNNSAYYATNTFSGSKTITTRDGKADITSNLLWLTNLHVAIKNCDVNANFTMNGDRAAVFCGGQVFTMHIEITDSSYDGSFYGANPGLVFANASWCFAGEGLEGSIKLSNVALNGNLVCLNGEAKHGKSFANSEIELEGITGSGKTIDCATDKTMAIAANDSGEYVITAATDSNVDGYSVQLSLGKLLWYDENGNVTEFESSNHKITIHVEPSAIHSTGIFKCQTLSTKQAKGKGISINEGQWKKTVDGVRYCFIDNNGTKVLIVDVSGEFQSTSNNVADILGNIDGVPTYYREGK